LEDGLARNFVFNVKLPQAQPWPVIKEALSLLSRYPWAVMKAKHLYHDRQEITLMGCVLGNSTEATSEEKSKH
jgi:23S rRNA C2498 (ribose-2'-O)-methylase RlmM